jgi:hypothetical protein
MNLEYDPSIWQSVGLEIKRDGHVAGQARSEPLPSGHVVVVSVTSYEYESGGVTGMQHVPHVVLTDESGAIVAEPWAWDAPDAERAVNKSLLAGEYAARNPEEYLD